MHRTGRPASRPQPTAPWRSARAIADGAAVLLQPPESNHGGPGGLKNAIDTVVASLAFRNKPAAFVGYRGGIAAGVRAIERPAPLAIEAEMVPLRSTVLIPLVGG